MNDDHLRTYMPTGGRLQLLLRAALTYSSDGGPFLVIRRRGAIYSHNVQIHRPIPTPASMCVLTGEDALAYAAAKGWRSVMDPTVSELRDLMRQAVVLRDVAWWATDFFGYAEHLASTETQERLKMIERGHRAAAARARLAYVR